MKRKTQLILLYVIIVLGGLFRFSNSNWDTNTHMHPDERAVILSVLKLEFPSSVETFLRPVNPWNPQFFAYGSFPFYLLRGVGYAFPDNFTYDDITIIGRYLSALFDLGTLLVIFLIGKKIKNAVLGLIAAFFYSISTLPIQLSHFYAVDTPLTFFITLSLYAALLFYQKATFWKALLMGISLGFALASKISAIILVVPYMAALALKRLNDLIHSNHTIPNTRVISYLKFLMLFGSLVVFSGFLTFTLLNPYAILDFQTFWRQTLEQQAMTKDAFTFPYTLQYVGKIPYLYELKNILLFGLGLPLSIICFTGTILVLFGLFNRKETHSKGNLILLLSFFICYFVVVGSFAIGFMRYMLPLYPLFCLFGAKITYQVLIALKPKLNPSLFVISSSLLALSLLIWPVSFMKIYTRPNTRIQATEWINKTIPDGSSLAIEHWDDAVPIMQQEKYSLLTLPLYDPDTPEKWSSVVSTLQHTDYIILASNRLYTPLQKLTNCDELPPGRCYPITARYYNYLFSGKLGFEKVAEFTSYPTLPLLNLSLPDQSADESFTVYDHPKIQIFMKVNTLPQNLLTM